MKYTIGCKRKKNWNGVLVEFHFSSIQLMPANAGKNMKHIFIMTVDVDPPPPSDPHIALEDGLRGLVEIFREQNVSATFFVTAIMAEKFTETLRIICDEGHEIACHSLMHKVRELRQDLNEQKRIIHEATKILESVTRQRPRGYRAPVFEVDQRCWEALKENGYLYDSSVVPTWVPKAYGRFPAPSGPYFIRTSRNSLLLELPVSVNPLFPMPLGGAWMRILGLRWVKLGVKTNFLLKRPVVFYIHPKDVVKRKGGQWWARTRTTVSMKMVDSLVSYVKRIGGTFITAKDFVKELSTGSTLDVYTNRQKEKEQIDPTHRF